MVPVGQGNLPAQPCVRSGPAPEESVARPAGSALNTRQPACQRNGNAHQQDGPPREPGAPHLCVYYQCATSHACQQGCKRRTTQCASKCQYVQAV
jgi:hypothetical protein